MDLRQKRVRPFESAGSRAKTTVVLLAFGMLFNVIGVWSTSLEVDLLQRFEKGAFGGLSELEIAEIAEANDKRQMAVGGIQILLFLATAIAFLMWFHRSHRNLGALGNAKLKYSPGWAVGGFFVPFLNLVRPYSVAAEIWKGSHPDGLNRKISSAGLVGIWWAFWIVNNVTGQFAFRISIRAEEIDELIWAAKVLIAGDVASFVAAVPAICMVLAISKNQMARFDLLNASDESAEAGKTGEGGSTFTIE